MPTDNPTATATGARAGVVDTVLFDLDGTINDSQQGIIDSLRHAFVTHGIHDPGHEALLAAVGPPFEQSLPGFGVSVEVFDALLVTYRERYEASGLLTGSVYPGVVDLLGEVASMGLRLAVATAKPEPSATRVLEHAGLADRFETIAGATHERSGPGSRRHKGEVIAEALRRLQIAASDAPQRVLMIGDRDHDVEGATQHGITTIGVAWGYGSHDELLDAGAAVVCDTPSEVAHHLTETYRS